MVATHTLPQDFETWNWKNWTAVFGLCTGFIAPILGSVVTVVSWFKDPVWHAVSLHEVGTVLFVLTLPLLIVGAHFLDLIDNDKKAKHASQRDDAQL